MISTANGAAAVSFAKGPYLNKSCSMPPVIFGSEAFKTQRLMGQEGVMYACVELVGFLVLVGVGNRPLRTFVDHSKPS